MILIKPTFEILKGLDRDALKLIELTGRVCYRSENKITEDSASSFVKRIVDSGHHSVIEHANVTVRLIIDRGVSHELVRHRLASYSMESTRYCRYNNHVTFIIPPWVNIEPGEYHIPKDINYDIWGWSMLQTEKSYHFLLNSGQTPQMARSVLPNSLKTEIIVTANLREWRHIFNLRCSKAAHPQMREIMIPLRDKFIEILPEVFNV